MKFSSTSNTFGINKMVNEHTVDYHPSPSKLTSRVHPLIFLWTPTGFISPGYFLGFFLKRVYCTMVAEKFHIRGAKIAEKYICDSKKLDLFIFAHVPKQNSRSGSYYYHSRQEEITHFPKTIYFFQQKVGRIMKLEK